jgi:pimeloyl-ACP methyl ester carboxylesterase
MFSKIILPVITAISCLQVNAQVTISPVQEEEFRFSRGSVSYSGTLTQPKGKAKPPAVILISGMGLQNRDWTFVKGKYSLAKMLSDSLTHEGFAVLRYDDRGFLQSTGTKETVTSFEDLAEDVYEAVTALRKRTNIGKIGLVGHSLGGILAVMVAARHTDIDFIITLAGSFQTGGEVMMEQARTLKRWKTSVTMTDDEVVQKGETFVRNWIAYSKGKAGGLDTMKSILRDLLRYQIKTMSVDDNLANMKIYKDTATMFAKEYQNVLEHYTSMHQQSFAVYDAAADLEKVICPVLVLFGQKDQHVTVRSNLPKVAAAISRGTMSNVAIYIIPGTDHSFSAAGGMNSGALSPQLLNRISCWLEIAAAN